MKVRDQEALDKWETNNTDPYGAECVAFAKRWADAMEERMEKGEKLEDIAEETSYEQAQGITGFMYGAGVSILASTWEHGEQLRQWHNLDTQLDTEGEKSNESGAVLNPAVVNLKVQ